MSNTTHFTLAPMADFGNYHVIRLWHHQRIASKVPAEQITANTVPHQVTLNTTNLHHNDVNTNALMGERLQVHKLPVSVRR